MSGIALTTDIAAGEKRRELVSTWTVARVREQFIRSLLALCALLSIGTTIAIIGVLVTETFEFFREASIIEFFTGTRWSPQYAGAEQHFGIWPLLCGTFLVAGIASLIGIPVGLGSAVYLSEYASPRVRNVLKPILEILAGIPTIVFGYFGLVFITPYVLRPIFQGLFGIEVDIFNAASAGIAVGIMIIPTISSLSEDVLRSVPRGLREAAYALGSTRFDVSVRVVVPAALSGILASFLLAIARAVGETMVVTIAAGMQPQLTLNPFQSIQSMTAFIVAISQGDAPAGTIEYNSLYAVAMTLFVITLATNILSQFILRRFREAYQ